MARDDGREEELRDVQLEEEGEERVGVHVERVWPAHLVISLVLLGAEEGGGGNNGPLDALVGRVGVGGVGEEAI